MKSIRGIIPLFMLLAAPCLPLQARIGGPNLPVVPALADSNSFSMILIPDPQSQNKYGANQPLFELMTAWTAQHIPDLKVRTVLVTGDMVEQNDMLTSGDPDYTYYGDQTSRQQWEAASRAMARLDNKVPYIISQGNHDVGYVDSENRSSKQSEYFYPDRNICIGECLVSTCNNFEGRPTLENSAYEFHDAVWGDLLVVTFEFSPRDEAIDWAKKLISSDRFKKHRVIILTHSFLNNDATIHTHEAYKLEPRNWPNVIWERLIYPSSNVALVICGHMGMPPKFDDKDACATAADIDYSPTCAYREERAKDGHNVPMMMFNSQMGDGCWYGNGGDCWLRILEFKPDGRTISVRTFSPLFALSPLTAKNAWRTASYDQFDITLIDK